MVEPLKTPQKTVIVREVDGTPHTVPVADLQLRNGVYGVIIKDEHVLLLPQRGDGYDFPGGGMERGETLAEALVREVFEETGLIVQPDISRPLGVGEECYIHPGRNVPYQCIGIYYQCTITGGTISNEHMSENEKTFTQPATWVPIETALKAKFYCNIDVAALLKAAQI